uniref:Uncharacterized protein n=1 Tax=Anguilla anguilla TaxID=7936 RepID=A0A0E9XGW4_ANGAN
MCKNSNMLTAGYQYQECMISFRKKHDTSPVYYTS